MFRIQCSRRLYSSSRIIEDPRVLAKHLENKFLINGKLTEAGASFEVRSPATRELVANAGSGTAEDVNTAVEAAHEAFLEWKQRPARERGALVAQCGEILREHAAELAALTALETGKALRTESAVEAGVLSDSFTFFGGLGGELKGTTIPWNPSSMTYTVHEPLGVCGLIVPWNAPLMLTSLKLAPALVAGNTAVVKSAEEAPLGVLRVAELVSEVLPPGVFNVVSGMGPETGGPLVSHPRVQKVSFTGSVETGKIVAETSARRLIPCTLELGGKSPMIVMPDCDMDATVAGALVSMRFTRAGQSCTAASRILVHEEVHDEFVKRMAAAVDKLVMGDPLDPATDIGTIISPAQLERVQRYISLGEQSGGTAIRCSALPSDPALKEGLYVQPVIFTGLSNDSQVCQEEIFGPVTSVIKFSSFDEAIELANATEFGLAATIWTKNLEHALKATQRLEAGVVQVNQSVVLNPNFPVGGMKNSGLGGREASLEAMMETFTKPKLVSFKI